MNAREIHEEIIDFCKKANIFLTEEGKEEQHLWYGGQFISGHGKGHCETLILSYNPGYSRSEWPHRKFTTTEFDDSKELKFISEYDDKLDLAVELVDTIFDKNPDKLRLCAETYAYSPFFSPGAGEIKAALKSIEQSESLKGKHDEIRRKIVLGTINHLNPKNVLMMGMTTWDVLAGDPEIKSALSMDTQSERGWFKDENGHDLLANVEGTDGPNLFVCKHLTGARGISNKDREIISAEASKLF